MPYTSSTSANISSNFLTHLFNSCLWFSHFPSFSKEAKVITLPKPGNTKKSLQNLGPTSLLSTTCKLFEKVILRISRRYTEKNNIMNPCQFDFHARHITTLQCMRIRDHVTFNFNNNLSMAADFLDV